MDPLDCESVRRLRSQPIRRAPFPGEHMIVAEYLMRKENNGFYGASNFAMDFDFLIGYDAKSTSVW